MADYCSLSDVNAYAGQVPFTARSIPSESTVADIISTVSNEIDSKLGNIGYVVPITGTKALAWCKETCRYGALGLAQDARNTGVSTATNASGREGKNIWTQRYEQRLKSLLDPQLPDELSDAPRTNEQLLKQPDQVLRSFVQGVTDDEDYNPDAPVVTRYQTLVLLFAAGSLVLSPATSREPRHFSFEWHLARAACHQDTFRARTLPGTEAATSSSYFRRAKAERLFAADAVTDSQHLPILSRGQTL